MAQEITDQAAVVRKLTLLEAQRKDQRDQRRQAASILNAPSEDVQAFLATFQEQQQEALLRLEQCGGSSASRDKGTEAVQAQLDSIALLLNSQDAAIASASYFLPAYDQKQCIVQVQDMRTRLEAARSLLVPKRKFAFASKVARTACPESSTAMTQEAAAPPAAALVNSTASQPVPAVGRCDPSERDLQLIAAGRGLLDLDSQDVVVREEELGGQEYALINLARCRVFLVGHLQSLRLLGLRDCVLVTGPVTGPAFLDSIQGCTLTLAAHQVRIHNAQDSTLYLRVRSRPIIEHSSGLRFAPYNMHHAAYQVLLQQHKLHEETGLWSAVDDFGWLKAMQSPNWCQLPDEQRAAAPDLPA
ncbi:tubulin binding cofactor C-domain-containing protein [Haematococcus lacustris]